MMSMMIALGFESMVGPDDHKLKIKVHGSARSFRKVRWWGGFGLK